MWNPPIVRTIATENKGIEDLAAAIESYGSYVKESGEAGIIRKQAIARWRLLELLRERLLEDLLRKNGTGERLESVTFDIADKKIDPYTAVEELLKS
jgi:LAO/AO transport system kinase